MEMETGKEGMGHRPSSRQKTVNTTCLKRTHFEISAQVGHESWHRARKGVEIVNTKLALYEGPATGVWSMISREWEGETPLATPTKS